MGILARDSPLPLSRIRFLPEADESVVQQINCGVVVVMAFWSGHSRQAYRRLTEVLAALDPGGGWSSSLWMRMAARHSTTERGSSAG